MRFIRVAANGEIVEKSAFVEWRNTLVIGNRQ